MNLQQTLNINTEKGNLIYVTISEADKTAGLTGVIS